MPQPTQNTDAYIMMQTAAALQPFKGQPDTREIHRQMLDAVRPYANALLKNGHSQADVVSLIGSVWKSLQ
jgi:trans-aconitate methyltransferase